MTRERLIFVTDSVPVACGFGPRHQSFRMVSVLSHSYDITLMLVNRRKIRSAAGPDPALTRLLRRIPALEVIEVSAPFPAHRDEEGFRRLRAIVSHFDHLFIDHPGLADLLPPGFTGLVFFHEHRDDPDDQLDKALRATQWRNRFSLLQEPGDALGYMLQRADIVFSEGNGQDYLPITRASRTPVPFAFNEHLLEHSQRFSPKPEAAHMLFVADSVGPLVSEALDRFLALEWADMQRRLPTLRFEIALPSHDREGARRFMHNKNVHVSRHDGSWERWSNRGYFFVSPLRHPTGASQILNAVALGMPVIAYPEITNIFADWLPLTVIDPRQGAAASAKRVRQDRLLWQRCEATRVQLKDSFSIKAVHGLITEAIENAQAQRGALFPLHAP